MIVMTAKMIINAGAAGTADNVNKCGPTDMHLHVTARCRGSIAGASEQAKL